MRISSLFTLSTLFLAGLQRVDAKDVCQDGSEKSRGDCKRCDPGYFSKGGADCRRCTAGTISDSERTACIACRPGFTSLAGSSSCTIPKCGLGFSPAGNTCLFKGCPPGTAVFPTEDTANGSECRKCPAPLTLYTRDLSDERECRLCPFHASAPPGSTSNTECRCEDGRALVDGECVRCPSGSFSTGGGACQTCPVGFNSGTGAASCTFEYCPFGFKLSFNGGKPGCEACGVDQYPTGTSSARYGCITCPTGSKVNRAGNGCDLCKANEYGSQGVCYPCPGNRVSVAGTKLGVFGCLCPSGQGVTSLDPNVCETCPPGQVNGGGLRCYPCKPGQEPNAIKEACVACGDGFYNADDEGYCKACPPFHEAIRDRTACTFGGCPPGQGVVKAPGQSPTCVKCDKDHFVAETGSCEICPAGKVPTVDKQDCKMCPENTYAEHGSCVNCPLTKISPAGSTSEADCKTAPTGLIGRRSALARIGVCRQGLTACMLTNETWECVDTQTDLQSCGGCWNDGSGTDCTELPSNRNHDAVQCIQGRCIVVPSKRSHRARKRV